MAKKRKEGERGEYGQGSIYKNRDGSYTVAVRLKDGEKPTRRRAPDEQSAELVRQALLKMREKGVAKDSASLDAALEVLEKLRTEHIDPTSATTPFDVFINRWFNTVVKVREGITERTLDHYRGIIRRYLLPAFEGQPIIQIKAPAIIAFLNTMRQHLSPSYVKQIYSALDQAFDSAVGWGWLGQNPCGGVEKPKVKKQEKPSLTIEQVRGLYGVVVGHPTEVLWHVMGTLGTRLGETLALRRSDFNADFSEVEIKTQISYHSLKRTAPKDDSVRKLAVPGRLQAMLAAQWELVCRQGEDSAPDFKNGGLMFPSEVGTPFQPSNIEKVWRGYTQRRKTKQGRKEYTHTGFKERASLPDWATIHALRTFVATTLEDLDVEERVIGLVLGHGAKNVTGKYIRRNLPTMRRALEKLEAAVWAEATRDEQTWGM
jgi:integrase